jgi:radical SAM protein with 4Fe4S-binding SPASM domain
MQLPGSFENTIQSFRRLKKLKERFENLIVGTVITQTNSNQDNLHRIYSFSRDILQADNISICLIRGGSRDPKQMDVDIAAYKDFTAWADSDTYRTRFPFWRQFLQLRSLTYHYVSEIYTKQKKILPCYSGRVRLVITPEGYVYPCEILMLNGYESFRLGDLSKNGYDIRKIFSEDSYKNIITHIKKSGCFCRHECDLITSILFNPRIYFGI